SVAAFAPGTDSVVTWMFGWVRMKSATIFLTIGSQIPDHMFQYVKCTTEALLLVLELAALVLPPANPASSATATTATLLARIHLFFISTYPLLYRRQRSYRTSVSRKPLRSPIRSPPSRLVCHVLSCLTAVIDPPRR